jgi:L-asparaginase
MDDRATLSLKVMRQSPNRHGVEGFDLGLNIHARALAQLDSRLKSGQSQAMKRLAILTTGGTIAMRADAGGAAQIALDAVDIVAAAPRLGGLAELSARAVLSKPSSSFTLKDLAAISQAVNAAGGADGILVTHGTDTMEETAFALELTLAHQTPLVLTGAMRRFDQPGADGAANLEAAGLVALSSASQGRGALLVMDDEIHWAPLVRKVHAFRTHAFSSAPFGPIGWVAEGQVRYALRPDMTYPKLHIGQQHVSVAILEAGPGLEADLVKTVGKARSARVVSLPGAGHVNAEAVGSLARLASEKPVVFATRTGGGATLEASYGYPGSESDLISRGLIPAGALDARKARILLMILLSTGTGKAEIAEVFATLP